MAQHLSYACETYVPPDAAVPNNSQAADPVAFDLAPGEGPDLARLKSILVATAGLVVDGAWTPEVQQIVVSAFHHGAPAFVNTITAVRNLTVPAAMALRVGLIQELPTHVLPGGSTAVPNPTAPIPIRTGTDFARICGFVSPLAMLLAERIVDLSNRSGIDVRFFQPPSGSGGQETAGTTPGSAPAVPPAPAGPATAASGTSTEPPPRGTSRRNRPS